MINLLSLFVYQYIPIYGLIDVEYRCPAPASSKKAWCMARSRATAAGDVPDDSAG
jgi:hypothetical protein